MRVLGLDIGFGHTKCYSEGIKFKFPTQLAYPPDDPNMEVERVNIGGREYVVGRDTKYASSYRIEIPTVIELVQHAPVFLKYVLDKFGKFDLVVTGLPPNAKSHVPNLTANLKSVTDAEVMIIPQGIGILYDVASTTDIGDDAVIIDIGYNTVDCIAVEKSDDVWKKKRGITLENFGIMKAVEIMREMLPEKYGLLKNWSASRLLETFEKGAVSIDGEKIDLGAYKNEAIQRYVEILLSKTKQELKDSFRNVATVVVAGGGAYYVGKKYFGQGVIPEEPEFSQARGNYVVGIQDNMNQDISPDYNPILKPITVKLKNIEVYKKYKLIFGLGRVVIESLLEILFERTEIVELQNAYLDGGEKRLKDFIAQIFER
jgi:hypothetical protein